MTHEEQADKRAGDIEIGDTVHGQRVSGWFYDAKGRMMLEYGGRWNRHSPNERLMARRGKS